MTRINERVQIHEGTNSMGGIYICEVFITGKIVKVNKKSIRVHMTHVKFAINGKITREYDIDEEATFTFWKRVENRESGKNAGKTVDIYKNSKYGLIEVVR